MNNNRQRVSIPVLGIDTSTTDTQIKDGAMQELHNLRYSGGAWRDIKPFLEKNRAQLLKTPNLITVSPDGTVTSEHPISMPLIVVTATWGDVDGVHTATTTTTIPKGKTTAQIEVKYDILIGVSISSPAGADPKYAHYSQFDEIPKVAIDNAIAPNKIVGVYQHPADEKDIYLIVAKEDYEDGASIYRVQIKEGKASVLRGLGFWSGNFNISHFGNILYLSNFTTKTIDYLYLLKGDYIPFNYPKAPKISHSRPLSTSGTVNGEKCNSVVLFTNEEDNSYDGVNFFNLSTGSFMINTFRDNHFWGEICYFAAFEMFDGTTIAVSPLSISISEPFSYTNGDFAYTGTIAGVDNTSGVVGGVNVTSGVVPFNYPSIEFSFDGTDYIGKIRTSHYDGNNTLAPNNPSSFTSAPASCAFAIKPLIKITIPKELNQELIKGVRIYSTRVNPLFSSEKILTYKSMIKSGVDGRLQKYSSDTDPFIAENKLPEQPFYLMKSIPLSDFVDGEYEMYITAELLENIEQKPTIYESIDMHNLYFQKSIEYNNRLHGFGELEMKLYAGNGALYDIHSPTGNDSVFTQLDINDHFHTIESNCTGSLYADFIANRIISYPDYRAKSMYQKDGASIRDVSLQSSTSNNTAWAINDKVRIDTNPDITEGNTTNRNRDNFRRIIKYPAYFEDVFIKGDDINNEIQDTITYSNRMRVSAPNNPFEFPLANTYAIGTEDNEIITVNSAAIELSDTKIGEFPLYVFTKEGIWVMRVGSGDILYDFSLPRFYDQAINPDTLAVNANLLYITSRGLHALHSSGTSLISEALNDQFNVPELDFWKTAHLTHQPKYEEVIVYNLDKDESGSAKWPNAYVFSLGKQTWSTRSWVSGSEKLFQTHSRDIVLIDDLFRVFDCNEEHRNEGDTSTIRLVSRPIKLGLMEFKRMETLIPRIEVDAAQPLHITIEASSDLVSWVTLRDISTLTSNHTLTIRRTSCSARYFRIVLEVNVTHNFALSGFNMEYYLRFLHRLR